MRLILILSFLLFAAHTKIFSSDFSESTDSEESSQDTPSQEKSFYEDHTRGWHWYERDIQSVNFSKYQKSKNSPAHQYPATEELKKYRTQLEEAKAAAVMHPTPQNVFNYQRMQYEMVQKSGKFAEVWMQHVYLAEQKKQTEEKIRKLSAEYGLFFFFKNDCPYCDAFAPVVKGFSEKYDWEVLAISEFGETHELFKRNVQDNGLAETWGVNTYPSLFAVNPKTGHVIPIAVGMISIQEMEERIITIAAEKFGETDD
jgi:conjugal transfer pilus assembly protein TraF